MKTIRINQLIVGEGIPKICVPIVGKTQEEILEHAGKISRSKADLAEWRADWYQDVMDIEKTCSTGIALKKTLGQKPLLFTFRTAQEGGEREITVEEYGNLYQTVLKSGFTDFIDVEMYFDLETAKQLIEKAHKKNKYVVASNHDFEKTPSKEEILKRLCEMQKLDADLPKIAVMPNSRQDVLTLLDATVTMKECYADRPIITMSMGASGSISRIIGEFTGSALTFASLEQSSAPGQLELSRLTDALSFFHDILI